MFLNVSNHPSVSWSEEQLHAARQYGHVLDLPFPQVPADCTEEQMEKLVMKYYGYIVGEAPTAVMVQGEMVFCYRLIRLLEEAGIPAVAAVTERRSTEKVSPNGATEKQSVFRFCGFREYIPQKNYDNH